MDTPDDLRDRASADGLDEYLAVLAVNASRAEVGRDALRAGELGFLGKVKGWMDYWTPEKRRLKAQKQLRDPETKRFIEERGSLDIPGDGGDVRARVDLAPEEGDALSIPGLRGEDAPRAPTSSPTADVVRLEGTAATDRLVDAGFREDEVKYFFAGRGVVFEVKQPKGANPVFVFVAHPDGLVARQSAVQSKAAEDAKDDLEAFEAQAAKLLAKGDKKALAVREEYRARHMAAQAALAKRQQYLRSVYGSGGNKAIGDYDEGMAKEAGAILAEDLKHWPPWELTRGGRPRPFMVAFDEGGLLGSKNAPDVSKTQQGFSPTGKSYFYIDRGYFRMAMKDYHGKNALAPNNRDTVGQHALLHEPGHVQDDRNGEWDSLGAVFTPFVQDAMKVMPIGYGTKSQREWFAEMVAFSRRKDEKLRKGDKELTPQQKHLMAAFRNLFMLNRTARAPYPSPAWVAENQEWLRLALEAVKTGGEPPALPNPAKFFPGGTYPMAGPKKKVKAPW